MLPFALRSFLTLFVVIDPVGMAPIFIALTSGRSPEERRGSARKAVVVAGAVLLGFAIGGTRLLEGLGISLDAFRIAGGLLLFRMALDMVLVQLERETDEEAAEARARRDIAVFPLAIPLTAGPGAMASVMILAGEARPRPLGVVVVAVTTVVVLGLLYLSFRASELLARVLGQTGVNVVTRVLGILLAALAVQYVADGVRGLIASG